VDERAPPNDPLVGTSIDHYRVVAKLGAGGMGVVYRAEDVHLRRAVALKVLPPAVAADAERRMRFLREARSAAALSHPNLATIYEAGEADGRAFLAMELVEGTNLRDRLATGRLDLAEALRITTAMARGLAHAHARGVVHRDLKPENVMVTPSHDVKILDFGLAKLREPEGKNDSEVGGAATSLATADGRLLGTPGYMSPEQARGVPIDARTDVYALGVILFEMLTAELPIGGKTIVDHLAALLRDEPTRVSSLRPDVPAAVDEVVARCLARDPARRMPSADALVEALAQAEHAAAAAHATTLPVERVPVVPPSASPRSRAGLLGLAALVAIGGLALALRGKVGAEPPSPAAATSASSAPSATPRPITMLDLPPPATTVPEAAREYALGMSTFHDDNTVAARDHFERAVKLDPSMAEGWLRLSMADFQAALPEGMHDSYARAAELRAGLTARDAAVMHALEPVLGRMQKDMTEAQRRLLALSRDRPEDAELYDWLAQLGGMTPATLPYVERALALDPKDANALQIQGIALATAGKLDEARDWFERCTALSPTTSDCLVSEAWTDMLAGRCDDYEKDARRLNDRNGAFGHPFVAAALVANGRSETAVREETALAVDGRVKPKALATALYEAQMALASGDFARARAETEREAAALAADPDARSQYLAHYALTMQELTVALETGDTAGARRIAGDFAERLGSWSDYPLFVGGADQSAWVLRLAPGDFEVRRRARVELWRGRGAYPGILWAFAFAGPASTPDEARAALDLLPEYAPLTPYVVTFWLVLGEVGLPDASVGHAYLLAGKPSDAVPYLRRAAAACADFDDVLTHTRAALELGQALQATGDETGACAAYGKVIARWGSAKPRSVTAEAARVAMKSVGCGKGK
jgi:serine/threonine-protein kinase